MLGAIITFFVVCVIFGIYMTIVHSFLREAEEPEDIARARSYRKAGAEKFHPEPARSSRQQQWAH